MQLLLHSSDRPLPRLRDDAVWIDGRAYAGSVLVFEARVEELPWPAGTEPPAGIAERLLAPEPELVILGSGPRQSFPPPAFRAALLSRRVGLEVMDNAAALRTYAVVAGEGRRALLVLLLP